jgi:hypothetical protein
MKYLRQFFVLFGLPFIVGVTACKQSAPVADTLNTAAITQDVKTQLDSTATDITLRGPIAWLDHFENTPDFFMASDGNLAFNNYASADSFIRNTLIKQIKQIKLKFTALRVNVQSEQYALVGATFHEDITDTNGKATPFDGYFTATLHHTARGWRYRNMHWSIKK